MWLDKAGLWCVGLVRSSNVLAKQAFALDDGPSFKAPVYLAIACPPPRSLISKHNPTSASLVLYLIGTRMATLTNLLNQLVGPTCWN